MAPTLTSTGSSDHGKFAALLRRRLRAVPTAIVAPILGSTLPIELTLLKK